jgi:threonyl-tRNA synthetase
MAQDDAHIYCEPESVPAEIERFFAMTAEVYRDLQLSGVKVSVSTRPERFLGDPEQWDRAEQALIDCVRNAGFECGIKKGEAAFYAPKVEFDFEDVLGRAWTLSTIQVDMAAPERFDLRYIGRDGQEHRPAMLHRAILGSLERFLAIYLEHTAGDFPLWLAPVQVAVLPITERHADYAAKVHAALVARGLRTELDARNEKLNLKIREAELAKIPVMLVVGDQEVANGTVTPRRRHAAKGASESMALDAFVTEIAATVAERRA